MPSSWLKLINKIREHGWFSGKLLYEEGDEKPRKQVAQERITAAPQYRCCSRLVVHEAISKAGLFVRTRLIDMHRLEQVE